MILFVDSSYAFNTIIPDTLQNKLTQLSVPTSICQWITSFLTDRQQEVRLGKFSSSTHTISTGAPQSCVLSPLLFSLYMNDCTSKYPSIKLLKFADNSTLISLIQDGDESAYRQEVKELTVWCSLNNMELNTFKRVEMIVDFRRNPLALPHLPSWTALWLQWIHSDYWAPQFLRTWSGTTTDSMVKKAQQRLYFLRQLRKFNLPQELLLCHHWIRPLHINNYLVQLNYQIWPQKTTEGSPDCWANHWYDSPHSPRTVLIQREQKGWQNHSGPITSSTLPLQTVTVWSTLQSSRTTRHRNSFFPQAIHLMNSWHQTWNTQHFYTIIYSPHTYFFFYILILLSFKFAHVRPHT